MTLTLSEIRIHPLKSARGIVVERVELDTLGPRPDRRWMAVDEHGGFLSQRSMPRLALVRTHMDGDALVLDHERLEPLRVEETPADVGVRRRVTVWGDDVDAIDCGDTAAAWLSEALERPVRLVRLAPDACRTLDPVYGRAGDRVAFADAFPLLLVARASLADLNARLAEPLPMERFRPNLVIDGAEPYEEDTWRRIRIGDVPIDLVKPCARCTITTTDQHTAERAREPLRTLARYRRRDGHVLFAQNGIHRAVGTLSIGDTVEVLGTNAPPRFEPPDA